MAATSRWVTIVSPTTEPYADDISVALLLTLERLSPLERAVFLLHDVFDMDYSAIAETLGRSEASCRQLAARAREHVREERPRFSATEESRMKLTEAFSAVVTAALQMGGTITGEHGVGTLKAPWLEQELGEPELERQRAVKALFDPRGILNPGRGPI